MDKTMTPVKGHESWYNIDENGRVYDHEGKELPQYGFGFSDNPYVGVLISGRPTPVHRLMIDTFMQPEGSNNKPFHKNGYRSDNRLSNLELCSDPGARARRHLTERIEEFCDALLPDCWDKLDLQQRRDYYDDPIAFEGTEPRTRLCAAEIWSELLRKPQDTFNRVNSREVNAAIAELPEWVLADSPTKFTFYGLQRYYERAKEE